jgi:hypothetical protein
VSAKKTGIVFVDVGWHRQLDEMDRRYYGLPPSRRDEPEVEACWNVEDETNPNDPFVNKAFDEVDEAIAWARERAPLVLVCLSPDEESFYSAGEGGADVTAYPEWPPPDWPNTSVPALPPPTNVGDITLILREGTQGAIRVDPE